MDYPKFLMSLRAGARKQIHIIKLRYRTKLRYQSLVPENKIHMYIAVIVFRNKGMAISCTLIDGMGSWHG